MAINQNYQPNMPPATGQPAAATSPAPAPADRENFWGNGGRQKLIGAVVAILIVGLIVAIFQNLRQEAPPEEELPISSPVAGASPVPLAAIEEKGQADVLTAYFGRVSPANFDEDFMDKVPQLAASAYLEYTQAADSDSKQESARTFYIYLTNPAVDQSDPRVAAWLADVKADLEKTLGKPLF